MEQPNNINDSKYLRANQRVTELKKFYGRCLRGLLAIVVVAIINYYLNEWSHPWFLWVVLGVGLGIGLKAIKLFGIGGLFGRDWERRKIRELMDKDEW